MILLVDLCYRPESLSHPEFVSPIRRIVERSGMIVQVVHYLEPDPVPAGISGIILCGTALKDNGYLEHPDRFDWIGEVSIPVLGICAGMQALARLLGGEVVEAPEIGMTDVAVTRKDEIIGAERIFSAYELHTFGVTLPPGCRELARSEACIQAFRHREKKWWGVMFHPEVRNDWVVERFVQVIGADR